MLIHCLRMVIDMTMGIFGSPKAVSMGCFYGGSWR